MSWVEANFDGLVGPTHNYAGLSEGNIASSTNKAGISSPRKAALQGLDKMQALVDMGMTQGILPPHDRPNISLLRQLGFRGTDTEVWERVWKDSPTLALNCASASSMWVANAATVSVATDCQDQKTHFSPANLVSMFHRSVEAPLTGRILKTIFSEQRYFEHHNALPSSAHFGDEGAANHTRFCKSYGSAGVELFVYGARGLSKSTAKNGSSGPSRYPARQTLEASQAIARRHGLSAERCVFAQQNPVAIDAGVFHNDVIAVGNQNLLFFHEQAFLDSQSTVNELRSKLGDTALVAIEVPESRVSLDEAVSSYLFNTQLITPPGKEGTTIIAPTECRDNVRVKSYLDELLAEQSEIDAVEYFDLRQSMKNGGGPACLRLRVALSESQISSIQPQVILNTKLIEELRNWVVKHYRDELSAQDLRDPSLIQENQNGLDELTNILQMGNIYDFQR